MKKQHFILTVLLSFSCLALCVLASIACGAKSVGFPVVIQSILGIGEKTFETSIVMARVPRTVFGILAGAALAVSGALMQAVTRNPIADPSILGVNTGASLFVVCGIAFLHISTGLEYIWLAFAGAALTAILVYGLASIGNGGATPLKLALAGAAASTALQSLVNTVMLPSSQIMDQFRFWQTGSIGGAGWGEIRLLLPFFLIGFAASIFLAPSLNTLALGDDAATGLGLNVPLIRGAAALAGVLLCASTTALAGCYRFCGTDDSPPDPNANWTGYAENSSLIRHLRRISSSFCGHRRQGVWPSRRTGIRNCDCADRRPRIYFYHSKG